jgi:hypothetical protein
MGEPVDHLYERVLILRCQAMHDGPLWSASSAATSIKPRTFFKTSVDALREELQTTAATRQS